MKILAFLYLPFTLIICLIGLIIRVNVPDYDPNEAFIYFISNYVCVGIKGLIVAGLLAVIMSTADSWLSTTSVVFTHIIGKIITLTEKQALLIARTFTFLSCILAIELTRKNYGIMKLTWLADNFHISIISIPLIAGFLKFRIVSHL
jgi:Na+/proline symporter